MRANGLGKNVASSILVLAPLLWGTNAPSAQKTSDQPEALFQKGLTQRTLGLQQLTQADTKPAAAVRLQSQARQHFENAAIQFAAANAAFADRLKGYAPKGEAPLPPDLEKAACARCCQAEMELRLAKTSEARTTVEPFLKDPLWKRSRYRRQAFYYHGFASFLLKDYLETEEAGTRRKPGHS